MEILTSNWNPDRLLRAIGREAAFGIVMALGNCLAAGLPEPLIDEYQVKAAFIYNFAKFVQWPAGAFQTSNEPIVICVLGHDPFGRSLEDTVAGRTIDGRFLIVRQISNPKQVAGCHVLFISAPQDNDLPQMLSGITTRGVLTIGESGASGADGVVISFRLERGKVHFDINLEAAERAKVRISSRLLSLAHVVESSRKLLP
jgi:hypothetical protein